MDKKSSQLVLTCLVSQSYSLLAASTPVDQYDPMPVQWESKAESAEQSAVTALLAEGNLMCTGCMAQKFRCDGLVMASITL